MPFKSVEDTFHERLGDPMRFIRVLLDSLGEGVLVLSPDYKILETNRGFLETCGKPAGEVYGCHCYEISHGFDVPCWQVKGGHPCPVRTAFATGEAAEAVHTHKGTGNEGHRIEVKAFPLKDAEGRVCKVIEVHWDISEKWEMERRIIQAQRLESIGTLAGGIAHDFNNLLTPILGNAEMALEGLPPDHPVVRDIKGIQAAARRAANLVQQILAYSRRQILKKRNLNLNEVIRNISDMLKRLLRENIVLETILTDDLKPVFADPGQIEQIIMNLAVNASDAMPEGGTFLLEARNVDGMDNVCQTCGTRIAGPQVLLMASDSGSGMDKETIAHIFEPFYTTKEVGKGTGMGLSTIVGIMHQHNGHINVYSEPGAGSTFKVYFPRAAGTEESIKTTGPEETASEITGGTETILLVEDDPMVRTIIERGLTKLGYTILTTENGRQALEVFKNRAGAIDLLLTDVIMPDMGGRELVKRLLAETPDLPVLFTSGYSINAVHDHYILKSGLNYIQKPYTANEVALKVRAVLDLGRK